VTEAGQALISGRGVPSLRVPSISISAHQVGPSTALRADRSSMSGTAAKIDDQFRRT
jgi:hypothetical protein